MAIELAERYLPYVDELFSTESRKSLVTNQDFDWSGAHTVKIYSINTAAMNDYDRNGKNSRTNRYGTPEELSASTQEMTLTKDRSFTFIIDRLDADETAGNLNGAVSLARQLREVTIPEVDEYTYGVMAKSAGFKPEAIALTNENIYEEIIKAGNTLDNAEVPENERVLIVPPDTYLLMKRCKDITMETNIGNDMRLKGVISNLDGCQVVKVPAARLPKNTGFMLCHSVATVAPVKLESYKTHEDPPGINGTLVEGRICYDAFVLKNKKEAIYYQAVSGE
ncbi:MAG: hypothetical protein K1W19_10965 [Lachnospiraceae bacterium]